MQTRNVIQLSNLSSRYLQEATLIMKLKIVGAHQGESKTHRFLTVMVDGHIALDAGSVATGLTLEEQEAVRYIFLSHYHFDHMKDVAVIGFNTLFSTTIDVYCLPVVKDVMMAHIFNESVWPKLVEIPSPKQPSLTFHEFEPYETIELGDYHITAYPTIHSVPSSGYYVEHGDSKMFFTSDTAGYMAPIWERIKPQMVITECTYPNRMEGSAVAFCHLTPAFVRREMEEFKRVNGYYATFVITHINPHYEDEIRAELAPHIAELGDDKLIISHEDMELEI